MGSEGIFERMRRWLIGKLGGYTEQFTPIPIARQKIVQVMEMNPQRLQATARVEPIPGRERELERYCKDQMTRELVRQLQESGFIMWRSEWDIFERKVNMRAMLYALNANDLHERFPYWEV